MGGFNSVLSLCEKLFAKALSVILFTSILFFGNAFTSMAQSNWTIVKDGSNINQIKFANSIYVAVGQKGLIKTSTDGINWTNRSRALLLTLLPLAMEVENFWLLMTTIAQILGLFNW